MQAKAILAPVRPRDLAGKTRRRLAVEQLTELVPVEKKIKALTAELKQMVKVSGSGLMDLRGVGPVVAARILADVGDVTRFADRNRFASWTGTAPIEASSGEIVRHRLSRAGNRRMNHVIHIAATTQIRLDTPGRAYYRRKLAAGKTRAEAMRCLKRRISDALYRQLLSDARTVAAQVVDAGPGGHRGASHKSSASTRTPAHRHFGSATSRARINNATRDQSGEEDQRLEPPRAGLLTTEGGRKDAAPDPWFKRAKRCLSPSHSPKGTGSSRARRSSSSQVGHLTHRT